MKTEIATLNPAPRRAPRHPGRRIILVLALAVLAIPFVVPTVWMIASSFKPLSEIFQSPPTMVR